MKNKNLENAIYSVLGVLILFALIMAGNIISGSLHIRKDMTENKIYTLTDGTKNILNGLDTPVTMKFYYSRSSKDMPVFLKSYATRIEDLLEEYKQIAGDKIILNKYDPKPFSDAEDAANLDGISGQLLNTGNRIYLGLAISCLDETVTLPFLSIDRENLLEYDLSRAVTSVYDTSKSIIGVMSGHAVTGEKPNQQMMMQGQQPKRAWMFVEELKKDYEVQDIALNTEQINDDISLLLIVHPKGIEDQTLFAIDQFILKGGKVISFIDPSSYVDQMSQSKNPMMRYQKPDNSSSLGKLIAAWGLEFTSGKIATDMNFASRMRTPQRESTFPGILSLTTDAFDDKDVTTNALESMQLIHCGAFSGTPIKGLTKEILLKTTEESQLVNKALAGRGDQIFKDFVSSGKEYALAVRLTGKFKTAFPEGKPVKEDDKNKKESEKSDMSYLKESKKNSAVVLIGDSDLLYDSFCVQVQNILGQKIVIPRNDNLNFLQNIVEHISGNSDLIGIRCRETARRPLKELDKRRMQAEKKYKNEINDLEKELNEVNRRLNEMQRKKSKTQQFILSAEQQEEIKVANQKKVEFRKKIKKIKKELRRDIESLQNSFKIFNIACMPGIIALFGLSLALYKRKRSKRK